MTGMDALEVLREKGFDAAITTDVIVIGHLAKASLARGDEVLGAERAVALRGGAVHNDEFDGFQFFHFTQFFCPAERAEIAEILN